MDGHTFFIVDVFANNKFTGNQVAVVKCPPQKPLNDREMQQIANELWFSETCFILFERQSNGGYHIRIFTPHAEVEFSGHPVLGAAYIISQMLEQGQPQQITINLKNGPISVKVNYKDGKAENLWLENMEPFFAPRTFEPVLLSKILDIEADDIDSRYPIQEVSTGLSFVIVPVKTLEVIKSIQLNIERYNWFIQRIKAKCILVFCPETKQKENNVHVRVFASALGIPEDSATGSGNGCLAAYLAKNKYFGTSNVDIRIEQGYEISRPSLIFAQAKQESDESITVRVGGQVILVAEGKFC